MVCTRAVQVDTAGLTTPVLQRSIGTICRGRLATRRRRRTGSSKLVLTLSRASETSEPNKPIAGWFDSPTSDGLPHTLRCSVSC